MKFNGISYMGVNPKMVGFPNNHGDFPTKLDQHLGCEIGVPPAVQDSMGLDRRRAFGQHVAPRVFFLFRTMTTGGMMGWCMGS